MTNESPHADSAAQDAPPSALDLLSAVSTLTGNQTRSQSVSRAEEAFARLIDDAPEESEIPAPPDFRENSLRRSRLAAIGARTGWPSKYLSAIEQEPEGAEWLAAFEIAKERIDRNGILVFYGKRGTGKTRMAAELAMRVGDSRYRTAMRFFLEIRATFRKSSDRSEIEIIDDLAGAGLLILDEIQERGETPFEDRLLTHMIDARYSANLPTVLIANLTKHELAQSLGDSIVDRARENGKSIEFGWGSFRAGK